MRAVIPLLLFTLPYFSCQEKNFDNQPQYEINVNETVDIYYTTNSCCYYCILNEANFRHVENVGQKIVDPGIKDCVGCDYVGAFTFKATSAGIDTVRLKLAAASESCEEADSPIEKYVVIVE